jgi:hypothetical protein
MEVDSRHSISVEFGETLPLRQIQPTDAGATMRDGGGAASATQPPVITSYQALCRADSSAAGANGCSKDFSGLRDDECSPESDEEYDDDENNGKKKTSNRKKNAEQFGLRVRMCTDFRTLNKRVNTGAGCRCLHILQRRSGRAVNTAHAS